MNASSSSNAGAGIAGSLGNSGAGAGSKASGRSFFERERERLVAEISDGIEIIMSNSNALNRKLEESIYVGKEFEPIAGLWGQFANVMHAAGIPDLAATAGAASSAIAAGANTGEDADTAAATAGGPEGEDGRRRSSSRGASGTGPGSDPASSLKRSFGPGGMDPLASDTQLPPGVAPGGGTVYGRE